MQRSIFDKLAEALVQQAVRESAPAPNLPPAADRDEAHALLKLTYGVEPFYSEAQWAWAFEVLAEEPNEAEGIAEIAAPVGASTANDDEPEAVTTMAALSRDEALPEADAEVADARDGLGFIRYGRETAELVGRGEAAFLSPPPGATPSRLFLGQAEYLLTSPEGHVREFRVLGLHPVQARHFVVRHVRTPQSYPARWE